MAPLPCRLPTAVASSTMLIMGTLLLGRSCTEGASTLNLSFAFVPMPSEDAIDNDTLATKRAILSTAAEATTATTCTPLSGVIYQPVPAGISAALAVCGCAMLIFGYRIFRISFLVSGFLLGAALSYVSLAEIDSGSALDSLGVEGTVCVVLAAGVLLGLLAAFLPAMGHITMAVECGALLAAAVLVAVATFYEMPSMAIAVGSAATAAATAGIAAAITLRLPRWQAVAAIICTSVFGAVLIIACLDYFLELHALLASTYFVLHGGRVPVLLLLPQLHASETPPWDQKPQPQLFRNDLTLCFYAWMLLASWPVLSAAGILLQLQVTAEKVDVFTELNCIRQKHRQVSLMRANDDEDDGRNEAAWQRYRNIYAARRSAGDVVATAYAKGAKRFSSIRGTPLKSDTDDEDSAWKSAKRSCKLTKSSL